MISQLSRHQQHRYASIAHIHNLAMDVLDRADIQAARRLVSDQQVHRAAQLTGHDHLLLVAARELEAGTVRISKA
jgi:hypothetical protein